MAGSLAPPGIAGSAVPDGDSGDWARFFDAARKPDELPADVRHLASRKLVPALLRTIDKRQLGDKDIAKLIAEIDQRHGGQTTTRRATA